MTKWLDRNGAQIKINSWVQIGGKVFLVERLNGDGTIYGARGMQRITVPGTKCTVITWR